jgi:2-haloacid dehalogenase
VLDDADRARCVLGWHRLEPWPDVVAGLARLQSRLYTGTLSNGSVRLLLDLRRHGALPLDVVFSAETFRHYKPDPEVYLGAIEHLATAPARVMLAAAHNDDLAAAKALGIRTAFIARPTEYGPRQATDLAADPNAADVAVASVLELADRLGA